MYLITASFEPDLAIEKIVELLAIADNPERLADRLGITRDVAMVKEGVRNSPFRKVISDLSNLKHYIENEKKIELIKQGKNLMSFLGPGNREIQLARLRAERRKFGSLIAAPSWFYSQPRVRLLSAIRDYALDGSLQGDASWIEVDDQSVEFPIVEMFETANLGYAASLVNMLEKNLREIDPKYLLQKFEGNRSIDFNFSTKVVRYYAPTAST